MCCWCDFVYSCHVSWRGRIAKSARLEVRTWTTRPFYLLLHGPFFMISWSLGRNQRSGVSLYHSLSFYNPMWGEASWIYTYSSESFFYSSASRQRWGDIQSDLPMEKKSWYKLLVPFPLSGGIFVCDMYTNIAREKFHYLPPTDLITISFY